MPEHMALANAAKSAIRARVEHLFAHQKNRYNLFIRTIGIARAQAKLTLTNLAYNFDRLIFHERCANTGSVRLKCADAAERLIKKAFLRRPSARSNRSTDPVKHRMDQRVAEIKAVAAALT